MRGCVRFDFRGGGVRGGRWVAGDGESEGLGGGASDSSVPFI